MVAVVEEECSDDSGGREVNGSCLAARNFGKPKRQPGLQDVECTVFSFASFS